MLFSIGSDDEGINNNLSGDYSTALRDDGLFSDSESPHRNANVGNKAAVASSPELVHADDNPLTVLWRTLFQREQPLPPRRSVPQPVVAPPEVQLSPSGSPSDLSDFTSFDNDFPSNFLLGGKVSPTFQSGKDLTRKPVQYTSPNSMSPEEIRAAAAAIRADLGLPYKTAPDSTNEDPSPESSTADILASLGLPYKASTAPDSAREAPPPESSTADVRAGLGPPYKASAAPDSTKKAPVVESCTSQEDRPHPRNHDRLPLAIRTNALTTPTYINSLKSPKMVDTRANRGPVTNDPRMALDMSTEGDIVESMPTVAQSGGHLTVLCHTMCCGSLTPGL